MSDEHSQLPDSSGGPPAAQNLGARVRDDAREVAHSAAEDARAVEQAVRNRAESEAGRGLEVVSREAHLLAQALRAATAEAEREGSAFEGAFRQASELCQDAAARLEGKTPAQALGELERVGREHPGAFFGAAVALGFASSRFVRAGIEQPRQPGVEPTTGRGPTRAPAAESHYRGQGSEDAGSSPDPVLNPQPTLYER